jgi:hypothetical protein
VRRSWVYDEKGNATEIGEARAVEQKAAMVMGDIQPYKSMVTGEMINSRSTHREHLKAHHLVEVGNETKYLKPKPKELPPGLKQRIIEIANSKL